MSDISKLGYEPIPLGAGGSRNAPDLSSLGLLPPLPKPAQPVEPRAATPKPELPSVKSEAVIDNKPEAPKPPLPGRLAWVPEAAKALLKPTKQKGIVAAGIASLIGGAMVANMVWPPAPVKPNPELAKVEPVAAVEPPRAEEKKPEPVKLPPPVVVEEAPFKLPPLNVPPASGVVLPAGGVQIPETAPPAAPPLIPTLQPLEIPKSSAPGGAAPPPSVTLPELPPLKPLPTAAAPPVTAPALPSVTAPPLPSVTAPPVQPPVSASPLPSVAAPPIPGVEIKPVVPEVKPVVPEVKPVETQPAVSIPESREPVFVPTGSPKPPPVAPPVAKAPDLPAVSPGRAPELPAVKPASAMAPREDYDVDVHYPAANDTWASVSRQHLADERYAEALRAYNGGRILAVNQPVDVPPIHVLRRQFGQLIAAPRPVAEAPKELPRSVGGPKSYAIPAGGLTMKELARKALGDENYWGRIWELNPQLRADEPVPEGTIVKLPGDSRIGD